MFLYTIPAICFCANCPSLHVTSCCDVLDHLRGTMKIFNCIFIHRDWNQKRLQVQMFFVRNVILIFEAASINNYWSVHLGWIFIETKALRALWLFSPWSDWVHCMTSFSSSAAIWSKLRPELHCIIYNAVSVQSNSGKLNAVEYLECSFKSILQTVARMKSLFPLNFIGTIIYSNKLSEYFHH